MRHKVGDTVRIHTQQWLDAQEKDEDGDVAFLHKPAFFSRMFGHAGRIAKITKVYDNSGFYRLDVDNGEWLWTDQMFDLNYRPEDEPLSVVDAIHAMMDNGETLYDKEGYAHSFNEEKGCFEYANHDWDTFSNGVFNNLTRNLSKRKRSRPMIKKEAKAWAESDASLGWMARYRTQPVWLFPRECRYSLRMEGYQRARMLPDYSGIDKSTIQGFEVEE